jgi:hypothetical protein
MPLHVPLVLFGLDLPRLASNVRPSSKPSAESVSAAVGEASDTMQTREVGPSSADNAGEAVAEMDAQGKGGMHQLVEWLWRKNQEAFDAVSPPVVLGILLQVCQVSADLNTVLWHAADMLLTPVCCLMTDLSILFVSTAL